jgi:chromosome partitioning protein
MKIFTTAAIKGGTGKSTTAAALAQAAAFSRKKVLAIDLDPAGNLSMMLGADLNKPGSYDLLHGEDPADLIQTTEQGVDVIPGSPNLATEVSKTGSAFRLQDALEPIRARYQFIFVDTPPTMGELVYNALQASTGLIIPLEADTSSVQGLYRICDVAGGIRKTNPALKIAGVVLTRYDSRPKLNRYLRDSIEAAGKEVGAPFLGVIRPGVAIKEAQALRQSLYLYAPKSKPAQDYMDIFKAIARK